MSDVDLMNLWGNPGTAIRDSARHEGGHAAAAVAIAAGRGESSPVGHIGVRNHLPEFGVPEGQTGLTPGWIDSLTDEQFAAVVLAGIYVQEEFDAATPIEDWLETVQQRPLGDADDDVRLLEARAKESGSSFEALATQAKSLLDSMDELKAAALSIGSKLAETALRLPIGEMARVEGATVFGRADDSVPSE